MRVSKLLISDELLLISSGIKLTNLIEILIFKINEYTELVSILFEYVDGSTNIINLELLLINL
jgi:hypothetical protein